MFVFSISFSVVLFVALLLSETRLQVEANECYYNSDCVNRKYCCKQRYSSQTQVCKFSCVGQPCRKDGDCGGHDECCDWRNYCTKTNCRKCSSDGDCDGNYSCCKTNDYSVSNVCQYGACTTTIGLSCSTHSDCTGPGECCGLNKLCTGLVCDKCSSNLDCSYQYYCCLKKVYKSYRNQTSNICTFGSCVGQSCRSDNDCGGPRECCRNEMCTKSGCYNDVYVAKSLASWLIAVIVVGGILVVVVIPVIVVCSCRGSLLASRTPARPGEVLNQETASTAFALQDSQNVQNNPVQFQSPSYDYPPPGYYDQAYEPPPAYKYN